MNKRLLAWPLMAAAALWTGCSNDEAPAGTDGGVRLVLAAEVAADDAAVSRTAIVDGAWTWSEGDRIGLFVENAQRPTQNVPAVFREVDGKVRFEARVNAAAAGDKVYAYYPYSEQAELGADGSVTLTLPDVQSQATVGVPDGSVMPMVAQPIEIPAEGGMGVLRFKPRMSMACF
ncbi:fimbrillin family protein [uncultured Alistipes sp.]|nr:fimbrillin family protein [uncultured Alistipes sp.]